MPPDKKKSAQARRRPQNVHLPSVAAAFLPPDAPPIRLKTRSLYSGAGQHDLIYISSYVHDAKFRLQDLYESGRWLVIPINRERQELPHENDQDATWVRSEILLGPVKWWTLEFSGRSFMGKDSFGGELVVYGLQSISGRFVEESDDEQIVIDCTAARLKARLTTHGEVRLVDLPPKRKRKKVSPYTIRLAWPMGG